VAARYGPTRVAGTVFPGRRPCGNVTLMRAAIGGIALLLLWTCIVAAEPTTRAECEAAGGQWGRFGLRQREMCDLPAPDAGKACSDKKDCVSACVAAESAAVGSQAQGTCHPRMLLLGTCLKQVRGGVVMLPLCAD
jgi:hypothetical protein